MDIKDIKHSIVQEGNKLYTTKTQEIPDHFLKSLDYQKQQGCWTDSKDMMKMASIPVAVVDQMLREGVDVYKAPIKDIIKWLKNNDCERFLTH